MTREYHGLISGHWDENGRLHRKDEAATVVVVPDDEDPRNVVARHGANVTRISFRGFHYTRDDLDTTTFDSTGVSELKPSDIPLCIVSADGCRFKHPKALRPTLENGT